MSIRVQCVCGSTLQAEDRFAGSRALCPYCRRTLVLPGIPATPSSTKRAGDASRDEDFAAAHTALDVEEFLDSPASVPPSPAAPSTPPKIPWGRRMLQALLDPRAIQWLLMLGGGLMVLGLVIGLVSWGIFENKYVVAVGLGLGSLAIHVGGCATMLKTRYQTVGRALTFLGCVVLPLNLWHYQYQDILTIDTNLWMAAFVICWVFIGTVYVLRDPLFLYAVEAGVTLTVMLLMASLGLLSDANYLSLTLLALAIASIHAERAFPPDAAVFSRPRFGLALFWSGHAQLAAALAFLIVAQIIHGLVEPTGAILGRVFDSNDTILGIYWTKSGVTDWRFVPGAIWLAGMYLYVYSDLVVRRIGVYTYLAAVCLMMAEVTIVGFDIPPEALIALMTLTAVGVNVALAAAGPGAERMRRTLPPLSLLVSFLAVCFGFILHVRATSHAFVDLGWDRLTGWTFVGTMLMVAIGNRLSAFLDRKHSPIYAKYYIFFSASGVIIGAAGLLRVLGFIQWQHQAPFLMIIPVLYLLASLLRTGRDFRETLQWVAHSATVVIVGSAVIGSLEIVGRMLRPVSGQTVNLLAGLVFAEAMAFYILAAIIRRKQLNVYLATIAACLSIWQFMGYSKLPAEYYTVLYAVLGLALLIASRVSGMADRVIFRSTGEKSTEVAGPGASFYLSGNAVLVMAFIAATLQGLSRLVGHDPAQWTHVLALLLTTGAGAIATSLVRPGPQRWWHATGTVVLAVLSFLTFNILLHLEVWRKAEVFLVGIGIVLLVASYIARFREEHEGDLVTIGLWLGSVIAALTPLVTVLSFRISTQPSLPDELTLLTITILMLASGGGLQFKAPTLLGGGALALYLATVIVDLAYHKDFAIGVYLAVGGCVVFAVGVALSLYRDRLLTLPDRFAKREGVFKIISWR